MEYKPGGDLATALRKLGARATTGDRVAICPQLAATLLFLPGRNIIHADLASRNVLVGDGWHVFLADFGLSKHISPCQEFMILEKTSPVPIRAAAPELLKFRRLSKASDLYALGMTFWEILSNTIPYGTLSEVELGKEIRRGRRPKIPETMPRRLAAMIQRMWLKEHEERPSAGQVLQELMSYQEQQLTD